MPCPSRWSALLTEKQLRRGVHRSTRELETTIQAYLDTTNKHPQPFRWSKTADDIPDSLAGFCQRISDSGR
jgi:hypothetical protein